MHGMYLDGYIEGCGQMCSSRGLDSLGTSDEYQADTVPGCLVIVHGPQVEGAEFFKGSSFVLLKLWF